MEVPRPGTRERNQVFWGGIFPLSFQSLESRAITITSETNNVDGPEEGVQDGPEEDLTPLAGWEGRRGIQLVYNDDGNNDGYSLPIRGQLALVCASQGTNAEMAVR